MSLALGSLFVFDNSYLRDLGELCVPWEAARAPEPTLVVLNDELAAELGVDAEALRSPEGVAVLAGNAKPEGAASVAMAYAGHQFGGYVPRLGDGRALLLGEVLDTRGHRRDLHLKGSGRTPFARGGDGKAPLGPMLREYVIGEAMHALGIPTTRALAVVATGEQVVRERMEPGAVLTRVAASHIRVGTFQFAAATRDTDLLRRLADHAIARHHPAAAEADNPYLALYTGVVEAQAALLARWMHVGFVHGVMNTDNMTISGETIDYGPCAFMDAYDPATVFSSIDHGGRYAYGNQPGIAQWNLARFAEALLPLLDEDTDAAIKAATDVLLSFADRYDRHWRAGMHAKLGQKADFTSFFRALSRAAAGDPEPARALVGEGFDAWAERWRAVLPARPGPETAAAMNRVNPVYVPRNHLVDEALAAAVAGDRAPLDRLLEVLARPFEERPGLEAYALPAPPSFGSFRTFCGT
jgi:uncharacterized protein YdiU (UPF0061 family)